MEPPPGSRRSAAPADGSGKYLMSQQSHKGPQECPPPCPPPSLIIKFMSFRIYLNLMISFLGRPGEAAVPVIHTSAHVFSRE